MYYKYTWIGRLLRGFAPFDSSAGSSSLCIAKIVRSPVAHPLHTCTEFRNFRFTRCILIPDDLGLHSTGNIHNSLLSAALLSPETWSCISEWITREECREDRLCDLWENFQTNLLWYIVRSYIKRMKYSSLLWKFLKNIRDMKKMSLGQVAFKRTHFSTRDMFTFFLSNKILLQIQTR